MPEMTRAMETTPARPSLSVEARYVEYFNRPGLEGWQVRKGMESLLAGRDTVPEPSIVAAALGACTRTNDCTLSSWVLEVVRVRCAAVAPEAWPGMVQELKPVLKELGI